MDIKLNIVFFLFVLEFKLSYFAPIENEVIGENYNNDIDELTYKKYLKEVISILTTDPEFKKKLMLDGKNIAENPESFSSNLAYVSQGIRTQLDELKRKELDRLRQFLKLKDQMKKAKVPIDMPNFKADTLLSHMDYLNPNSFEAKDFDKLIRKTASDLEEIDKKRNMEYKKYEMMKELERREQFQKMSDEERSRALKNLEEMRKKHEDHPKLHHPGNKEQLKEIWENEGMNKEEFNPKTFFFIHDTNGDSYWDDNEVEALFQKELDKAYNPEAPEDDMVQRYEDMYKMREHVINEVDSNKDRVISLQEFLDYSSKKEFKNDQEWETIDSKKVYTEEELSVFEKEKKKIINQAKNKVRNNIDANIVKMHQDGGEHMNIPQQHDNSPHMNIPLQLHIPQQQHNEPQHHDTNLQQQQNKPQHHDTNLQQQQNIPQHNNNNQQQHHNIPLQMDNAPHQNIPQQQHIPQQEILPQHQENALPVFNANQHDDPQQHDLPQQHDNVPQQQHIPEDNENQQHYIPPEQENLQNVAPQQYESLQQHDNIPQQQHIPEVVQHYNVHNISHELDNQPQIDQLNQQQNQPQQPETESTPPSDMLAHSGG